MIIENTSIVFAVLLVFGYMLTLVKSQSHSLGAIRTEYVGLMGRLKHSYPDQYGNVSEMSRELDGRRRLISRYLTISLVSVILSLVFTVLIYLWSFSSVHNFVTGNLIPFLKTMISNKEVIGH